MAAYKAAPFPANSRAIVITEVVAMGGAERCCLALSRWLHERNLTHHFVTYRDSLGLANFSGHPITVVELRPAMNPLSKVAALGKHLRQLHSPYSPLMSGYQPALHATIAGVRGFHTLMHDTPSLLSDASQVGSALQLGRKQLSHTIVAHGLGSGGRTIVASNYLRDEAQRVFDIRADLLPIGAPPLLLSSPPRKVVGTLRMLSVSRLVPNKRLDWIIRALAALENASDPLSREIDWSFAIVGEGQQGAELAQLILNLNLTGRIQLHGFLQDAALRSIMDKAHLMLIPARQGYGIPAIEAIQSGIPILLHRDSGVSDLLLDTPWVTIIEGGEESLAPALRHAMRSTLEGRHLTAPLPALPTEDAWAEQVANLCNWL